MTIAEWFSQNWVNLFSTAGIVASLAFTAVTLRSETKTRRVTNLLTITGNHREIWQEILTSPSLARVLDPSVNLIDHPISPEEEVFVNLVILHTGSVFYAMKEELVGKLEGLRRDVAQFFSLPIPRAIWDDAKLVQNDDFVAFVESCRNWK